VSDPKPTQAPLFRIGRAERRVRDLKAKVEANRCWDCGAPVPSATRETCPPCELKAWRRAQ